jgi:hypothetical protein
LANNNEHCKSNLALLIQPTSLPKRVRFKKMGYSFYYREGMNRGYGVNCKCHKRGCKEKIDRGLAFLCYNCTQYFCPGHLTMCEDKVECFAGESNQVCEKCSEELEKSNSQ